MEVMVMNKKIAKEFIIDISFLVLLMLANSIENSAIRLVSVIIVIIMMLFSSICSRKGISLKNVSTFKKLLYIGAIVSGIIAGVLCFIFTL